MNIQRFSTTRYRTYESDNAGLLTSLRRAAVCRQRWSPISLAICVAVLSLSLSLTVVGQAADHKIKQAVDQNINKNWRSIAIKGYDPVAYFTMGEAVEGKSRFEYRWQDARWRFASEKHKEMFAANPLEYAPRFGGYCAEGMAVGRTASIDPLAWLIVDGELYLNYSVEVRDNMALHPRETIEKADRFWHKLQRLFLER